MAMYHLSTTSISRGKGRSAVASAAYQAGERIKEKRTGRTHNYTYRTDVVKTSLHIPQNCMSGKIEQISRSSLWNMAEQIETRKNSRTARKVIVNLAYELSEEERGELIDEFAKQLADRYQIAVDVAVYPPVKGGDSRNHHAQLMLTTRKLEMMKDRSLVLTEKAQLELSNTRLQELDLPTSQQELKNIRKIWADRTNQALERAGYEARIDHRSHKERGLDTKPTIKMGKQATRLERMGISTDVGDINREIKADNIEILKLKSKIAKLKSKEARQAKRAELKAKQAKQAETLTLKDKQ